MTKFVLMVAVLACATLGVECWASGALRKFCDGVDAKEIREDRSINRYQEGGDPRSGNSYFWTSDGGRYQIEHFDSLNTQENIMQERILQKLVQNAEEFEQSISLCVSQSTSPYTVKMIEVNNESNDVNLFWD